jgi:uncharacterized membrane protein (UPF0127 family)
LLPVLTCDNDVRQECYSTTAAIGWKRASSAARRQKIRTTDRQLHRAIMRRVFMGRQRKHILVLNRTKNTTVCHQSSVADTFLTRLIGLLGTRKLDPGKGLLIQPSSGVHTFGMAFSIDIVALDLKNHVVGAWACVGPGRVRGLSRKTRRILELPSGQIERSMISVGDELLCSRIHP